MYIKPGTFVMGSQINEPGRASEEIQHKVTLTKGFYMQTTEVTQKQWKEIMGNNPSYFKNCGENCPVETVSWFAVKEFIKRLNEREGVSKYRLPTEAEWEYSARAGSTTAIYSGSMMIKSQGDCPELDEIAWYIGNSCVNYKGGFDTSSFREKRQYPCTKNGTHPVAGKKKNKWGLYDMIGNVWEWCEDFHENYVEGHVVDPKNLSMTSDNIIYRGGSWLVTPRYCRSAYRHSTIAEADSHSIGFRLCMSR